ncbi:MAG: hypothetical protein BGO14_10040 [Chlamydiales bacterium 38-26]|nr:hypothetical protein [Chlamydiales bacterium]OJV11305.1 MAG: hypothetical protein BGO14_10040 [Chlamydiales bacterium 38-26]
MRSYYAHLENATTQPTVKIASKPVFRSSAIFPMVSQPGISARLLFMGYWILKRHIHEIAAQINLRAQDGTLLNRTSLMIREPKTYRIELKDQLIAAGLSPDMPFKGSLEIEFFSTTNLVFPFPAVVVNYYGPAFSTVVHTAQRVYNDFDDLKNNSQTHVPEAGFNIYATPEIEPFFSMINGAEEIKDARVSMEFYNIDNEKLVYEKVFPLLKAYETCFIYPAREVNLYEFLKDKPGTAKIKFDVRWIFPRLLVGNFQHSLPAMTITHTYYDCSQAMSDSDYWRPAEPGWHPASLMIPVSLQESHFTRVYFYPIYSPSQVTIDVEIYNQEGRLLGKKENYLKLQPEGGQYQYIPFKEICHALGISTAQDLGARLVARSLDNSRIPARIKLGLDLGADQQLMPCNICTNLQPFNPSLENKPTSFRWAPILADNSKADIWIMNSSPHVEYNRSADIELTFFREKDDKTFKRKIQLPPHGFQVLNNQDPEIHEFLDDTIGWFTAVTTNPYTTTYYFTESSQGVVGGDHGF